MLTGVEGVDINIVRDDYARTLSAVLAYGVVQGVQVREKDERVEEMLRRVEKDVKEKYSDIDLKNLDRVKAYRSFMWKIGIDPTKIRPASEALLRRAVRGALPRINSLVDLGNAISLRYLVPIGIYDLDNAVPPLTLRKAKEGEVFLPIGRGEIELKGNELVLSDSEGPMHLFPYRDSRRTMVTLKTKNALVVAAGVPGIPSSALKDAVKEILQFLSEEGAVVSEDVRFTD